jgi:hypothetical protein
MLSYYQVCLIINANARPPIPEADDALTAVPGAVL